MSSVTDSDSGVIDAVPSSDELQDDLVQLKYRILSSLNSFRQSQERIAGATTPSEELRDEFAILRDEIEEFRRLLLDKNRVLRDRLNNERQEPADD
ncbi:MAG: hypothetical protein GXP29_08805 [Planctomycetes bacterium]|nr:hypothetical protein [Planctomycetota bacterium]